MRLGEGGLDAGLKYLGGVCVCNRAQLDMQRKHVRVLWNCGV